MRGPTTSGGLHAVDACARERFTPVNANGSTAVAVDRPPMSGGQPTAFSIQVLDNIAGRLGAIHVLLDPALFDLFGVPGVPAP
jgi:hypothetical protein